MSFISLEFAVLLVVVFCCYWFFLQRHLALQNALILIASYVFYGWWDWRFLSLIVISSSVDFSIGRMLAKTEAQNRRRLLLGISIAVNLGILGFFKYFNFFVESLQTSCAAIGFDLDISTLQIVLPIGISFYTFQTLSYTIDIYRRKTEPTHDVIAFFTFVSFFPQLVAGPIERARNLLPQFQTKRSFDYAQASDGMRQILWGVFKKVVIADNCAPLVNEIFARYETLPGIALVLGAFLFAFQIYCDFSGYSDIAIGTAKLFGIRLMTNFRYPYFSRNVAEFWQRWHISLSTWFRDYVYIPLGGSQRGQWLQIRNVIITFAVSGLWHGANWTFVIWGLIHGLLFLPLVFQPEKRKQADTVAAGKCLPSLQELRQMALTFCAVLIAWIFFRAESLEHALGYLSRLFSIDRSLSLTSDHYWTLLSVAGLVVIEWCQRSREHALQIDKVKPLLRYLIYLSLSMLIVWFGNLEQSQDFIYFQF